MGEAASVLVDVVVAAALLGVDDVEISPPLAARSDAIGARALLHKAL